MSRDSAAGPRVQLVVDLGFGDSGKGLVTDALVRKMRARAVVRFNGGAQAGHNVVLADGRHHTFSQLGAGTFVPGTLTFLSRHVVVHPAALLREAAALDRVGVRDAFDRLHIDARALVVTPFHQAAARLRELSRGAKRHGSCGAGVGEAVADALAGNCVLRAADLLDGARARARARLMRERKLDEIAKLLPLLRGVDSAEREIAVLYDRDVADAWLAECALLLREAHVAHDDFLARLLDQGPVVFEGAQGVLLDERHGFHPFTTWSNCTFDNALSLLDEAGYRGEVRRVGVLRSFLVRHGPGPFPTEDAGVPVPAEAHNRLNAWQGPVRAGWPDWLLLRYALDACRGADALAVTHLDALQGARLWKAAVGYLAESGPVRRLSVVRGRHAAPSEELARLLAGASPLYREFSFRGHADLEWTHALAAEFGLNVAIRSYGPTAADVRFEGAPLAEPRSRR